MIINERNFEWDNIKAMINEVKHGVRFEKAALVFSDEYKIIQRDEKHSRFEERFSVIGMVEDVLFVVYTERKENLRIISARRANENERSLYYGDSA